MGSFFEVLGASIPLALGLAVGPWPIITLIVLLTTPGAVPKSYAYLAGWFLGLMLVGILVLISPGLMDESGEPSQLMGWIRLCMGAIFLVFSVLLIKDIPKRKEQKTIPKWIEKVDDWGYLHAMGIGFLLSTLNIKNASMTAVGSASIGRHGLDFTGELFALLIFCLIASIGVMIPHIIYLLFRKDAERVFTKMKIWLLQNRVLILMGVLILFGGMSLYKGSLIIFFN